MVAKAAFVAALFLSAGLSVPSIAAAQSATDVYGPAIASAPIPAESQYVYLATVSHLLEGVTPAYLEALKTISGTALSEDQAAAQDIDALQSQMSDPILLQADPAAIVGIGYTLISAGEQRRNELKTALADMEVSQPSLTNPNVQLAILENGVRFRAALAQAVYATEVRDLSREQQGAIETYSDATYQLRDGMELMQFDIALGEVTDEAIDLQRSAFAALQRGIIDEIDPYSFEEDGKRARQMSAQGRAGILGEMRNMYLFVLLIAVAAIP
ncbi:MAG: hypothetical protein AAGJ09_09575 [Pseudomonadota bacterium]